MRSFVVALLLFVASMARAAIVYEQPPSSTGALHDSSWVDPDGNDSDMWAWDDFKLATNSNIVRIDWVGGHKYGIWGPVRDFTITFYPSIPAGSEPNILAPIVEYNVGYSASETYRGTVGGTTLHDYHFYLPAPFLARANVKYWVQIEAHQWLLPDWGLADATGGNGAHFRHIRDDGYQHTSGDCAFRLSTTEGKYAITTSVSPGDAATITGDGLFSPGSNVNLVATPAAGYSFVNWTEGKQEVDNVPTLSFKANRNWTLVAHLEPWVESIQAAPTTLKADEIINVIVSLSAPAPRGFTVTLTNSRSDILWSPPTLIFDEGETYSQFYLQAPRVPRDTRIRLVAKTGLIKSYVDLTIKAPRIAVMSVTPPSVIGGTNSTLKITLDSPCDGGGYPISLSANSTTVGLPTGGSISIPGGYTWWTWPLTTAPVTADTFAKISAIGVGFPRSVTLKVRPPTLKAVGLLSATLRGGKTSSGSVTLNGPASAGGTVVALDSSDRAVASVPATVTVPEGSTSAAFTVKTVPVTVQKLVTIKGTLGSVIRTRILTVNP